MTERRQTPNGLTEVEIEMLAKKLAFLIPQTGCKLTPEQQDAVIDMIIAKKKVVRWTLYIIGAMVFWILKDIYLYITKHIVWGW